MAPPRFSVWRVDVNPPGPAACRIRVDVGTPRVYKLVAKKQLNRRELLELRLAYPQVDPASSSGVELVSEELPLLVVVHVRIKKRPPGTNRPLRKFTACRSGV